MAAMVYVPAYNAEIPLRDAPIGLALETIADAVAELRTLFDTRISNLEANMAVLGPSLDRLEAAVRGLGNTDVSGLLEAERARVRELVAAAAAAEATRLDVEAAEAAEDVAQNQALSDAVAAYQAAVAETDTAVVRIDAVSGAMEALAANPPAPDEGGNPDPTPEPPVVPDVPTDPVVPTPVEPTPLPEPAPEPAPDTGDDGVIRG
jgi:hypothetical protein